MTWRDLRACADLPTAMFFPGIGDHGRDAKAVCAECPVRTDCLEAGMAEEFGIWGGLSERQRRRVRQQRRPTGIAPGFDRPAYMREYKRKARAEAASAAMPSTEYGRRLVALLMQADAA